MSKPYEEIFEGETCLRPAPDARHEQICRRLHERMASGLGNQSVASLLEPRTRIPLTENTEVCPDLAIVMMANNKLFLAAEVIGSDDHRWDTVTKKTIYEEIRVPRLWMVDPRYNNVEVYHGTPHGLELKQILAVRDVLKDPLFPGFQYSMVELFQA